MLEILAAGLIQGSNLCYMQVDMTPNLYITVIEECYVLDYVLGDGVLTIEEFDQVLGVDEATIKHSHDTTI